MAIRSRLEVDVVATGEIPRHQVKVARERLQRLERHDGQPERVRLTLRRLDRSERPYVADATTVVAARLLAAHAASASARVAVEDVAERLSRQVRRALE